VNPSVPAPLLAFLLLLAACGDLTRPERVAEQSPAEVSPAQPPEPGRVPEGGGGWAAVSAGRDRTCALDVEGRAWCWGTEGTAPLGTGGATHVCFATACSPTPTLVRTALRFTSLSVGALHACAIDTTGRIWCWGDNGSGQLGIASPFLAGEPVPVSTPGRFTAVAAGVDHSCAIRDDTVVLCWGGNGAGQLGRGSGRDDEVPAPTLGTFHAAQLSAGDERSCALAATGEASCWGAVWQYSQDGIEYSRRQPFPDKVPQAPRFAQLSVGTLTTCGLDLEGAAWCWEANGFGQMGTTSLVGSRVPLQVAATARFRAITAGLLQSCAVDTDYRAWCWGNNTFGQLGAPQVTAPCAAVDLACSRVPVQLPGSLRFTQLSTGPGSHVCGITTLTNLYCWGLGTGGQLGLGDPAVQLRRVPTLVPGPHSIKATDR
jgi:alpha-tubulin suppressor-like RCC1 family protein